MLGSHRTPTKVPGERSPAPQTPPHPEGQKGGASTSLLLGTRKPSLPPLCTGAEPSGRTKVSLSRLSSTRGKAGRGAASPGPAIRILASGPAGPPVMGGEVPSLGLGFLICHKTSPPQDHQFPTRLISPDSKTMGEISTSSSSEGLSVSLPLPPGVPYFLQPRPLTKRMGH